MSTSGREPTLAEMEKLAERIERGESYLSVYGFDGCPFIDGSVEMECVLFASILRLAMRAARERRIPVTERLPERGSWLAWTGTELVFGFWDDEYARWHDRECELREPGFTVTHWRPMPEGPEEGAHEPRGPRRVRPL